VPAAAALGAAARAPGPEPKVIGYFTNWVEDRKGCEFLVKNVDPGLFSHINFAFAQVDPGPGGKAKPSFRVSPFGEAAHDLGPNGLYAQVNALKAKNPKLKTLLSIGGWAHTDPPMAWLFTTMAETRASRGDFIAASIRYVRDNGFDGIDIDWEYPADPSRGGRPVDTRNFTSLLAELREAVTAEAKTSGKEPLLITLATPAGSQVKGFELGSIHRYVDWINLMTYDFTGSWQPVTGMNAPNAKDGPGIQEAVATYLGAGVPPEKIVLGMPTYGHTFAGVEGSKPGLPHKGAGPKPRCTGEGGSIAYFEVAELLKSGRLVRSWDAATETPYAYDAKEKLWVTFDDVESYQKKLDFLENKRLGGAMFWAIDLDDYANGYPLISTVRERLVKRR
jgi:chitinase